MVGGKIDAGAIVMSVLTVRTFFIAIRNDKYANNKVENKIMCNKILLDSYMHIVNSLTNNWYKVYW